MLCWIMHTLLPSQTALGNQSDCLWCDQKISKIDCTCKTACMYVGGGVWLVQLKVRIVNTSFSLLTSAKVCID